MSLLPAVSSVGDSLLGLTGMSDAAAQLAWFAAALALAATVW